MSGLTVQAHILVMEVISSQCGTSSNRSIMAQWNLGCAGGYDVGLLISSRIVCRHLQEVIILLLGCFGLVLKRRTCIYLCLCASVPLCIDFLEIERLICKLQNMDRYSCVTTLSVFNPTYSIAMKFLSVCHLLTTVCDDNT